MSSAKVLPFKEILFIEMGQSPKSEFVNNRGEGIPLLNGPAEFTSNHPVPKQFTTKASRFSEQQDILFCVRGSTTGRMNISDQKYAIGRGLAAIRHRSGKELNSFVRGLIEQNLTGLLGGTMGSVFPNLTRNQLLNYKCVVPDLSEQKHIAKILSDLDSKIEINNRINSELEAMAKLIYDYWFVQFDFPFSKEQAKAMGKTELEGKPYKSSGGKMVFNEELKREIPEGWESKPIVDEFDTQYGFPFSTKLFNESGEGNPVIRIRDILKNSVSNYSTEKVDAKYKLERGDLLLGMDGNFHLNFWSKEGCYLNQRSFRIRKKEDSRASLFQALFTSEPIIKAREKNVSRTTVGHLSASDIKSLFVLIPSQNSVPKNTEIMDKTLDKIMKNRVENEELKNLRDWLLPMLMNGQVKVPNNNSETKEYSMEGQEVSRAADGKEVYGQ